MMMPRIVYEAKITLGQIILAIIFILGTTVTLGKTLNDVADAKKHALDAMPRTEMDARLNNIDKNIEALRLLVYEHVARPDTHSSKAGNTSKTPSRGQQ